MAVVLTDQVNWASDRLMSPWYLTGHRPMEKQLESVHQQHQLSHMIVYHHQWTTFRDFLRKYENFLDNIVAVM